MRIDAHAHAMHAEQDATGKLVPPLKPAWSPGPQTPAQYIEGSRAHGVDQILVLDPPETTFPLREIFGDYVLPAPQVDLDAVTAAQIDDLFKRGAVGIKFICPMHSYGDNRYFPFYDVIRQNNGLAVFHTGYLGDGLHRPGGLLARKDYVDINHMRPSVVDRIARAFPDLKILMAHFGNPWWEEAWKIMTSHKNIYADFSGGTAYRRSMAMWAEIFKPDGRLDTGAIGKLCFATDCSYCFQGKYDGRAQIEFYDRFLETLKVPAELCDLVNWGTIRKLTTR